MAMGTKKNFRCTDDAIWEHALAKAEHMRRRGYDVDLTLVLNRAVRQFADESIETSAEYLELSRSDTPVTLYRRPVARAAE